RRASRARVRDLDGRGALRAALGIRVPRVLLDLAERGHSPRPARPPARRRVRSQYAESRRALSVHPGAARAQVVDTLRAAQPGGGVAAAEPVRSRVRRHGVAPADDGMALLRARFRKPCARFRSDPALRLSVFAIYLARAPSRATT